MFKMHKLKSIAAAAVAATALVFSAPTAKAGTIDVDLMFVVDQSGSMGGEFTFLSSAVSDFFTFLTNDSRINSVQGGLISYASSPTLRQSLTSNVTALANAFDNTPISGATERAYAAVTAGINELNANGRAGSTKSIILITDEDADDFSVAGRTTLANLLDSSGILNNIIYNFEGCDFNQAGCSGTAGAGFGDASDDFDPIARPNGAIFDINLFRDNRTDFFNDFAATKLQEIIIVNQIPLPAAGWLLIAGVGGMVAMGRRKKKAA